MGPVDRKYALSGCARPRVDINERRLYGVIANHRPLKNQCLAADVQQYGQHLHCAICCSIAERDALNGFISGVRMTSRDADDVPNGLLEKLLFS